MAFRYLVFIGFILVHVRLNVADFDLTFDNMKPNPEAKWITWQEFENKVDNIIKQVPDHVNKADFQILKADGANGLRIAFNLMELGENVKDEPEDAVNQVEFDKMGNLALNAMKDKEDTDLPLFNSIDSIEKLADAEISQTELYMYFQVNKADEFKNYGNLYKDKDQVNGKMIRKIFNDVDADGENNIDVKEYNFFKPAYEFLSTHGIWKNGDNSKCSEKQDIFIDLNPNEKVVEKDQVKPFADWLITKENFVENLPGACADINANLNEPVALKIAYNLIDINNDQEVSEKEFADNYDNVITEMKVVDGTPLTVKTAGLDQGGDSKVNFEELKNYFASNDNNVKLFETYPELYKKEVNPDPDIADKITLKETRLQNVFNEIAVNDEPAQLKDDELKYIKNAYTVLDGWNKLDGAAHQSYYDMMVDYYFELELEQAREEKAYRSLNEKRKSADQEKQYELEERKQRQQLRVARARSPKYQNRLNLRQYQKRY